MANLWMRILDMKYFRVFVMRLGLMQCRIYFDLYLYSSYTAHYVYGNLVAPYWGMVKRSSWFISICSALESVASRVNIWKPSRIAIYQLRRLTKQGTHNSLINILNIHDGWEEEKSTVWKVGSHFVLTYFSSVPPPATNHERSLITISFGFI